MRRRSKRPAVPDIWRGVPARSHLFFLVGVFFLFVTSGLLTDVSRLGANSPARLMASSISAGGLAVAYVASVQTWRRYVPVVIGVHFGWLLAFDRLFGPMGPPLAGSALRFRLSVDVSLATACIMVGFSCLSTMIRHEGIRSGRTRAEIALAHEIHARLVPRIERRIGGFEFRGVSVPSGAVGGDLIDLVESAGGWTSFVADASGHGVAAGLMMGMVKSAARTELRSGGDLAGLASTLNGVLCDLTHPAMFATFAGLQAAGPSRIRFTVAGHLPILQFQSSTGRCRPLAMSQLPLAMFPEALFVSDAAEYAAGDLFVLLTDGLTEVFDADDREFGIDAVAATVAAHGTAPLETIETRLFEAANAHGPQLDDQTLLLVRAI
jgi:hypothetical protein